MAVIPKYNRRDCPKDSLGIHVWDYLGLHTGKSTPCKVFQCAACQRVIFEEA